MTTTLASLLRKVAEKMAEKFRVSDDGFYVPLTDGRKVWVDLDELGDTEVFTLDHMDAIASAVGMFFEIRYDCGDWLYAFRSTTSEDWIDEGGMFQSKREASLAALVAILEYVTKEGKA